MDRMVEPQRLEDDVALDLKGILAAVVRRLPFILICAAIAGGATLFGLTLVHPRYTAETKILIESREVRLDRDRQAGDPGVDDQAVASQVQLLTSRDLARRVADRLRLGDMPEFDGTDLPFLEALLVQAGLAPDPLRTSPEERVVDEFAEHLTVFPEPGTRVITVQFQSRDRGLASEVANAVADEYMRLQGEAKRQTSEEQTRWLGDEIEKLQDKVRDAEAAVERYRSGRDLFFGESDVTLARQQLSDISRDIAAAESDQAEAEARASQLQAVLSRGGSLEAASEVLNSDTYAALRGREIALRSRLSELLVTYLPGHPQVRALESQIADIVQQSRGEARRILSSLQNDARTAAARVAQLQESLNRLKVTSTQNNESSVELRALERDATSQRDLLEAMLTRYREAVARQNADALPADARVISRAATPVDPSFPRIVPMTTVATLAGFLLSLVWVVAAEFATGRALVRIPAPDRRPQALVGGEALVAATEPTAATVEPPARPSARGPSRETVDPAAAEAERLRAEAERLRAEAREKAVLMQAAERAAREERARRDVLDLRASAEAAAAAADVAGRTAVVDSHLARLRGRIEEARREAVEEVAPAPAVAAPREAQTDPIAPSGAGTASAADRPAAEPAPREESAVAAVEVAPAVVQPRPATPPAQPQMRTAAVREAKAKSEPAPRIEPAANGAARSAPTIAPLDAAASLSELRAMLVADGSVRIAITGLGAAGLVDTLAAGFSALAIEEGSRVVTVDAVRARRGRTPGLSDLLTGQADFGEIIRRNPRTRAHTIGYGRIDEPADGFDAAAVDGVLAALEHTYDIVVLDLGPLLEADDVRLRLMALADHVVLVGDPADPDVVDAVSVLARTGIDRVTVMEPAGLTSTDAA